MIALTDARPFVLSIRQSFRACGRKVVLDPQNLLLHVERLSVARDLPGHEPLQGALADFFFGCQAVAVNEKRRVFEAVRGCLSAVVGRRFEPYLETAFFPSCTEMATRWSVLVCTSLDLPRRVVRCSTDDSRQLVGDALDAWRRGDETAQAAFLEHCRVCEDTLAFMLARRVIIQEVGELPPAWRAVCLLLQQAVPTP